MHSAKWMSALNKWLSALGQVFSPTSFKIDQKMHVNAYVSDSVRLYKCKGGDAWSNSCPDCRRSKLFFEARKLRKREKIFGTWTQAGKIMVKVKDSDQPVAVISYHELTKLIQEDNPPDIQWNYKAERKVETIHKYIEVMNCKINFVLIVNGLYMKFPRFVYGPNLCTLGTANRHCCLFMSLFNTKILY